ncbi:MAG: hypothetical protein GY730_05595 [bacterium]|nr:hypothetical protein [bacterium]
MNLKNVLFSKKNKFTTSKKTMKSKEQLHSELWSFFEYFLGFVSEGVHLECFSLIDQEKSLPGKGEAYLYEKITRAIVFESAEEIKAFAREYVKTEKLNQVESTSKPFRDSLKEVLFLEIRNNLNAKLLDHMIDQVKQDEKGENVLIMVSLYYSLFKNSYLSGYVLHPFYFKVFIPFLNIYQKKFPDNSTVWQNILKKKLLNTLKNNQEETYNLKAFFEDKSVKKIIAILFAGILTIMNEEKDLTKSFFFVTNNLKEFHLKTFKIYIANGYYTATNKPKRFSHKNKTNGISNQFKKVRAVPTAHISGIINSLVDRTFNDSLDTIIKYYQSGKNGKFKKYLIKNYDRSFQDMNKNIWKEIRKLVKSQMQVCYRSKYLLRLVIHYVFEKFGAEREFWTKYIPNVERIIQYIYKQENEQFIKVNEGLNQIIDKYKESKLFQGTDWEGFYKDPAAKKIAAQIIQTIVDKGSSKQDKKIPAIWFTNILIKGIDDTVLLQFFIRGLNNV